MEPLNEGSPTARLARATGAALERRSSRRGFLARATLTGCALALSPVKYLTRPVSAAALLITCSDCNQGDLCCTSNSVFCCTLTGVNVCPSGTTRSGWWKCSYGACAGGTRYFIDCNGGCGQGCRCPDEDCFKRKTCCNSRQWFNCNSGQTLGKIRCRIVTCTNPGVVFDDCSNSGSNDNTCGQDCTCCP